MDFTVFCCIQYKLGTLYDSEMFMRFYREIKLMNIKIATELKVWCLVTFMLYAEFH